MRLHYFYDETRNRCGRKMLVEARRAVAARNLSSRTLWIIVKVHRELQCSHSPGCRGQRGRESLQVGDVSSQAVEVNPVLAVHLHPTHTCSNLCPPPPPRVAMTTLPFLWTLLPLPLYSPNDKTLFCGDGKVTMGRGVKKWPEERRSMEGEVPMC